MTAMSTTTAGSWGRLVPSSASVRSADGCISLAPSSGPALALDLLILSVSDT